MEILLRVFHSNFLIFSCIFQPSLSWSLWSGYQWKDRFLLQILSIDEANFRGRWWRQKLSKARLSSRPVTGGIEDNGCNNNLHSTLLLYPFDNELSLLRWVDVQEWFLSGTVQTAKDQRYLVMIHRTTVLNLMHKWRTHVSTVLPCQL